MFCWNAMAATFGCACATPASAFRNTSSRGCSTVSFAPIRHAASQARGWAWRSRSGSPTCTGQTCRWRANPAPDRPSPSHSPRNPRSSISVPTPRAVGPGDRRVDCRRPSQTVRWRRARKRDRFTIDSTRREPAAGLRPAIAVSIADVHRADRSMAANPLRDRFTIDSTRREPAAGLRPAIAVSIADVHRADRSMAANPLRDRFTIDSTRREPAAGLRPAIAASIADVHRADRSVEASPQRDRFTIDSTRREPAAGLRPAIAVSIADVHRADRSMAASSQRDRFTIDPCAESQLRDCARRSPRRLPTSIADRSVGANPLRDRPSPSIPRAILRSS